MGAPAGFENTLIRGAWSKDDNGRRVAVGGADRTVCVWDVESGKVLYKVRFSDPPIFRSLLNNSSRDTKARSHQLISIQRSPSVSVFVSSFTLLG